MMTRPRRNGHLKLGHDLSAMFSSIRETVSNTIGNAKRLLSRPPKATNPAELRRNARRESRVVQLEATFRNYLVHSVKLPLPPDPPDVKPTVVASLLRSLAWKLRGLALQATEDLQHEVEPDLQAVKTLLQERGAGLGGRRPSMSSGSWRVALGVLCLVLEALVMYAVFRSIFGDGLLAVAPTASAAVGLTAIAHWYWSEHDAEEEPPDGPDGTAGGAAAGRSNPLWLLVCLCLLITLVRAATLAMPGSDHAGPVGEYVLMLAVTALLGALLAAASLVSGKLMADGLRECQDADDIDQLKGDQKTLESRRTALTSTLQRELEAHREEIRELARLAADEELQSEDGGQNS